MSARQQESVEQTGPAWCVALEELRSEIKELRAEQMETKERLLLYLQKLMDQTRLGSGATGSTEATQTEPLAEPAASVDSPAGDPDDQHDRGQDSEDGDHR